MDGKSEVDGSDSIVLMSRAGEMLAKANTIQAAKELRDLALTAKDWAQRKGLGEQAVKYAAGYALEAERRVGELLEKTELAKGGQPYRTSTCTRAGQVEEPSPTIAQLGLTRNESSRAQFLAQLPRETFDAIKEGKTTITEAQRQHRRKNLMEQQEFPPGKFRIIYADPPWPYGNSGLDDYGHAERHYPAMPLADLCALDVKTLAADNAVLFLWATSPMLEVAFNVVKAWRFEYKTSFVWDKVRHNFGHYNSVRHELLLVCTRGSCTPDHHELFDSVITLERSAHSEKPDHFRQMIDTLYRHGSRVELFARTEHHGWKSWGNELRRRAR